MWLELSSIPSLLSPIINLVQRLQLHVYIIEELQFRKYLLNKCFGNVGEVFRNNLAWSLCLCETISRWNFLIPSNNQYDLRMDLLHEAWVR